MTGIAQEGIMVTNQMIWKRTKDDLVAAVKRLGFPAELGEAVAKHLGSPKAMERMISYLSYVNHGARS